MNPILTQTQQLETTLHSALHATKDTAELAIYADALLHLQWCIESLEKLSEPKYHILEAGEAIQVGDEFLTVGKGWSKLDRVYAGEHITETGVGYYRRPIITINPQDFRDIDTFLTRVNSKYAQGVKQEENR